MDDLSSMYLLNSRPVIDYMYCQYVSHRKEAFTITKIINSEYDQEIPQSQTADNPMAP